MKLQKRTSGIDIENKLGWLPGRKSQLNEYLLGEGSEMFKRRPEKSIVF